jgi:stage II sporulation protein R
MKRFFLIAFALFVAMMSWEGQLTAAPVRDNGPIPQESIRLRILANSDSIQDQWVKREVRDAIVAQMNVWVKEIRSYDEAKQVVAEKLPELQKLVDKTLRDRGFSYGAVVDFGKVPFPTKLYGSYVYPAGNYEALRVRIGEAKGQNWWCVLFPPLCFIDMSNGDAVQAKELEPTADEPVVEEAPMQQQPVPEVKEEETEEVQELRLERLERQEMEEVEAPTPTPSDAMETSSVETDSDSAVEQNTTAAAPQVEVRFFLWEKLAALF